VNKEQYLAFHKAACEQMIETTRKKNNDYTGITQDPFANFTAVESQGICSTETGFRVRMTDKIMRLDSFIQKGVLEVKDETVQDTLFDLANYCILLAGYIESKRQAANNS